VSEEDAGVPPGRPRTVGVLAGHRIRDELLDLLAEAGTVTATEAARRLGHSSGLCSFHLRQLARFGKIEEVPGSTGRARPWRLPQAAPRDGSPPAEGFGELARGLEDDSYRRWLVLRDLAPVEWQHDEAFSAVAYLTPEEMSEVAEAVRQTIAPYLHREQQPAARPAAARPVALITRLFPLLPPAGGDG
jgi:hypothetical protein